MMLTNQELQTLHNMGNEAADAASEIERLRDALAGMVVLLETLSTKGRNRHCYVQSRGGQMVHVADAVDSVSALLGPNAAPKEKT
jgi:hypothetical protein